MDEALARLGETDRNAILLRYFEQQSLRDVGLSLGLSEEAAKKRVARALEKLNGNQLQTARLLGITRNTLRSRIAKFGLRPKVKVVIGGAPTTERFAHNIGEDGFAPDAHSAVLEIERLAGQVSS